MYRSRNMTTTSDDLLSDNSSNRNSLLKNYKVIIEYHDEEGKRPSVRLSNERDLFLINNKFVKLKLFDKIFVNFFFFKFF